MLSIAAATQPTHANVAVVSNEELRKMRSDIDQRGKGAIREAAMLTAADIARMKEGAKVTSEKDAATQKKIFEE